jgi:hypothetical protein
MTPSSSPDERSHIRDHSNTVPDLAPGYKLLVPKASSPDERNDIRDSSNIAPDIAHAGYARYQPS